MPKRRYVYGIIRTDEPVLFEVSGIDAGEVYTVGAGRLAVVTSPVERDGFVGLERADAVRHLTAHQRVLEAIQQDYPVLPVKFGTVLADEERLLTLLQCGADLFAATLDAYAGREQFEVVVLWDVAQVFQSIAADEQILALKAQVAALPPEESAQGRAILGRLVHQILQVRRAAVTAEVLAILSDLAEEHLENPVMDDAMVCNLALLIPQDRSFAFDDRLSLLDARFKGALQIRCVGPLPPYTFATLEVQQANPDAVAAALAALRLSEGASYAAVKSAYRRLAALAHPDHNSGVGAVAEMETLSAAYRLLTAVAQAQAPNHAEGDWPCHFDRASVENTLMFTLRRPEIAPRRDEE